MSAEVICQGLSGRNVVFPLNWINGQKQKCVELHLRSPHTYSQRRDLNFPMLRSNTAFAIWIQHCRGPRKRGQPVPCPDTGVSRHWCVQTLVFPDTGVCGHWCVRKLVCADSQQTWIIGEHGNEVTSELLINGNFCEKGLSNPRMALMSQLQVLFTKFVWTPCRSVLLFVCPWPNITA